MPDSATNKADLRALLALINSAAEDAIAAYENAGCDAPNLDEPSAQPTDALELKKAMRLLEGATTQLCATLAPPPSVIFTRTMAALEQASLRVAIEAKVADLLEQHPAGLHVDAIGAKVGIHGGKLARVLRCLASRHIFREVAPDTFANNRLSLFIRSTEPMASLVLMQSDELNRYSVVPLYDALTDAEYGPSYDNKRTPFAYGVKDTMPDSTVFDWYGHHPDHSARFGRGMVAMASVTEADTVVKHYPWHLLPEGSKVCDVGGGVGAVTAKIARSHMHLRLTLQDLPNVLQQARGYWAREYPKAVEEQRINFVPIDFFQNTPVEGQDIYYIRQCLHDWPDADCVKILENIRKAMSPSSRLIIHEFILQPSVATKDVPSASLAPKPLLPNYGDGSARKYQQDVNMLAVLNAKERTAEELTELGKQAGLELVRLWDFVDTGLVELKIPA